MPHNSANDGSIPFVRLVPPLNHDMSMILDSVMRTQRYPARHLAP